jgi:Zn-dependent peptidase ImmA (M78 family)
MDLELPASWTTASCDDDLAPPPCDPVAAASALLARVTIRAPEDIRIELIAAAWDAFVVPRRTGSADARVVRDGKLAFIGIAPEALATPRGRFSTAHELAHHWMHRGWYDAIARIHGAPRTRGREFRVEREANACASELLLPRFLFLPLCTSLPPTLDSVSKVASMFRTSLTATARRWAALSGAPCAWVESRGHANDAKRRKITEAKRGAAFRGEAFGRRVLEPGTVAEELAREGVGEGGDKRGGTRIARVHGAAWGAAQAGVEIVEESLRVPGTSTVLTWLWHA